MQLNKAQIAELNQLLTNKKLVIPEFRREVYATGGNYQWLQKNIRVKNANVSPRVKELLKLT
jgi:hypothetical protein